MTRHRNPVMIVVLCVFAAIIGLTAGESLGQRSMF